MQGHPLKTEYTHPEELRKAAAHYDDVHNHTHHYSTQHGMTPYQAYERLQYPLQALDGSFEMPSGKLLLERGEIHVIRFVRSNLKFSVFGLSFPMPDNAKYEYEAV